MTNTIDTEPKHGGVKRFTVRSFDCNANGGRFGEATPPYTDKECIAASDFDSAVACLREIATDCIYEDMVRAKVKRWLRDHGIEDTK